MCQDMKVENCSTISAYPSFLSRNLDNGSDVIIRCPFFLPHCHELKTSVHQRTKVICRSCGICYHTPKELGGISSTHVSHEQMLSVSDSLWPHGLLQAPLSIEFSRQDYWHGFPFFSPGDLPNQEIEPGSLTLQADSLPSEPPGKPYFHFHASKNRQTDPCMVCGNVRCLGIVSVPLDYDWRASRLC